MKYFRFRENRVHLFILAFFILLRHCDKVIEIILETHLFNVARKR